MNRRQFLAVTALAANAAEPDAQWWPEFRGPTGQGLAGDKPLPLEWSDKRNVQWKTAIDGNGWSSPVTDGSQIWLTAAKKNNTVLAAVCLDASSGRIEREIELFQLDQPSKIHAKNSPASPTPILDAQNVWVHFGAHGTACLSRSGDVVWKQQIRYGHHHGPGGSPVRFEDLLILSCDGDDAQFVLALEARTGKQRWRANRPSWMAYSTPLIVNTEEGPQLISPGAHRATAYEPKTGKEVWSIKYGDGFSNVPRPVSGHGLVYICTGFFAPEVHAVRFEGAKGDVSGTHVAWKLTRGVPFISSPLLAGTELYVVSDNGILTCLDALTGQVHYRQRLGGNFSASPVYGGGHLYFLNEDGVTTVVKPGKEFVSASVNHLDGMFQASIAVTGPALLIRSSSHLFRIAT